jgi:hypothetical protein
LADFVDLITNRGALQVEKTHSAPEMTQTAMAQIRVPLANFVELITNP